MTAPWVMGLAAAQHNGAACLMHGDDIVVAIAEERLSRVKRQGICGAQASRAFEYCLASAGLSLRDLDRVVLCTQTAARSAQHDVRANPQLRALAKKNRVQFISHHYGHALSTLRWAGTGSAAIFVADGLGSPLEDLPANERRLAKVNGTDLSETVSMYVAYQWRLEPVEKLFAPSAAWLQRGAAGMPSYQSLGGMYAAVSRYLFHDAMEAGKVMGLAAHADAKIAVERFLKLDEGRIEFLDHLARRYAKPLEAARLAASHKILAASVQRALEEAMLALVRRLRAASRQSHLFLAGGIALNAIANERIISESGFRRVHIIPAADDSGTAVGAAVAGLLALGWQPRCQPMRDDGLGHAYDEQAIATAVHSVPGLRQAKTTRLARHVADRIAQGQIGGWMQGGAEFGPRALGHRSILADPRRQDTKRKLDKHIKLREGFRPYAPSVLHTEVRRWFDIGQHDDSPFMLRIVSVHRHVRRVIPAVVHVDGTARVQTVRRRDGAFYRLIQQFQQLTGVPLVLNTSFNVRGEPIVETPQDALWGMLGMDLDFCVIGSTLLEPDPDTRSVLRRRVTMADWAAAELKQVRQALTLQRDPLLIQLLSQVNGHRTGNEIGTRLASRNGERLSPARLRSLLARLGGLQLITLEA